MLSSLELLDAIANTRRQVLGRVDTLTVEAAKRPPPRGGWSVAEIVEHLVRAEEFGIVGLWSSIPDGDTNSAVLDPQLSSRTIDEIFHDLPAHVDAPPPVEPRDGGEPLGYWVARLRSHDALIAELAEAMERVGLASVVYPHHIAGPLDGRQRLQFFRWHLERHLTQIDRTVGADLSSTPDGS